MGTVQQFSIKSLHSEAALGFCREIEEKLALHSGVAQSAQGRAFVGAISAYRDAIDVDRQMTYADLVRADAEVDQAIVGLRTHLQALLGYPVAPVRDAATEVWNAIERPRRDRGIGARLGVGGFRILKEL